MNIIGRFYNKFTVSIDGCWIWNASKLKIGYGLFSNEHRKTVTAHRWIYERTKGAIPPDLIIDHICRNPSCVNPDHLQAITQSNNIKRSLLVKARSARTHCKHGHEFTPENTRYVKGQRGRRCATCAMISKGNSKQVS
jgi:hypothetical protein